RTALIRIGTDSTSVWSSLVDGGGKRCLRHRSRISHKCSIENLVFLFPSENIILDEKSAHPAIRVNRGTQAHYIKEKDPENLSVRMHLHVFSKQSFSSGQHYWEVKVKERSTEKLSWYVGVARENVERKCNVPLTPQNGFWILSFDKGKGFHVNTDPQPPITVEELTIVGVFLDCNSHTLSFYNVDTESLLYTFTDVKTSNYFPVFSPGQPNVTSIFLKHLCNQIKSKA
uniref:B30.2/SPRY domain-containing protein n=1 Tax=Hucho hucho TaxID=62062 RepID=A0A4W5LPM5_9TELE